MLDVQGGTLSPLVWNGDNTAATATFIAAQNSVADGSVEVVSFTDVVGNPGTGDTDTVTIDTVNPSVTDVTVNDLTITDADVGTGTFSVQVTFSEAMDPATTPTLTFAPDVASTLTQSGAGVWSAGNTVYTATYDVADANVVANGVTIDVTGAQDAEGNAQQPYTAEPEFDIDTAAPTATVAITAIATDSGTSSSDYVTSDTTLTVSGTHGALGAGEKVQVSSDGGASWADVTQHGDHLEL